MTYDLILQKNNVYIGMEDVSVTYLDAESHTDISLEEAIARARGGAIAFAESEQVKRQVEYLKNGGRNYYPTQWESPCRAILAPHDVIDFRVCNYSDLSKAELLGAKEIKFGSDLEKVEEALSAYQEHFKELEEPDESPSQDTTGGADDLCALEKRLIIGGGLNDGTITNERAVALGYAGVVMEISDEEVDELYDAIFPSKAADAETPVENSAVVENDVTPTEGSDTDEVASAENALKKFMKTFSRTADSALAPLKKVMNGGCYQDTALFMETTGSLLPYLDSDKLKISCIEYDTKKSGDEVTRLANTVLNAIFGSSIDDDISYDDLETTTLSESLFASQIYTQWRPVISYNWRGEYLEKEQMRVNKAGTGCARHAWLSAACSHNARRYRQGIIPESFPEYGARYGIIPYTLFAGGGDCITSFALCLNTGKSPEITDQDAFVESVLSCADDYAKRSTWASRDWTKEARANSEALLRKWFKVAKMGYYLEITLTLEETLRVCDMFDASEPSMVLHTNGTAVTYGELATTLRSCMEHKSSLKTALTNLVNGNGLFITV